MRSRRHWARPAKCSPATTTGSFRTSWWLGRASAAASCRLLRPFHIPRLDVAGAWAFGHYTHEKNPVTARAALTTIEIIEDEGLVENAARVGAQAIERLQEMSRRLPAIGDVRGRGLMLGIELVKDRSTKEPDDGLAQEVLYRALDQGLSFKTTMGNVLTLTPPLVVTAAEMMQALDIVERVIVGE